MEPRTHFKEAEDDKKADDIEVKKMQTGQDKCGQIKVAKQDDKRTAAQLPSTLNQQEALCQIMSEQKIRECSQP